MKNLIKIVLLLCITLLFQACLNTNIPGKIQNSTYPSRTELTMVVSPPIIMQMSSKNIANKKSIEKGIYFLYKLKKNIALLDIKKKKYSDRFDKIYFIKNTKNNTLSLKNILNTFSNHKNEKNFSFSGIILSNMTKKEPLDNTLKIGFAILDKTYPSLIGFRSVKEKGKKRYTEFIELKNIYGNSQNYKDIENLIKFFILMPIHTYSFKNIHKKSFTLIKEKYPDKIHIYRYSIAQDATIKTFDEPISQNNLKLPKSLNLITNYNDYCQLLNMSTAKKNKKLDDLDIYPHTKSRYLPLDKQNIKSFVNFDQNILCQDKYPYDIKDFHIFYNNKKDFDKIIKNSFITEKFNIRKSPILDMVHDKNKLYIVTLDASIAFYDFLQRSYYLLSPKTNKVFLSTIAVSKKYIIAGGYEGSLYFFDKSNLKIKTTIKPFKNKILSLTLWNNDKLLVSSIDKNIDIIDIKTQKIIKKFETHTYMTREIYPYKDTFVSASFGLKLWNQFTGKLLHAYPKEKAPIISLKIWKNKAITASWDNSIKEWSLIKPYKLINNVKLKLKNDIISDLIIYKNKYILSSRNGNIYIAKRDGKILNAIKVSKKINKIFYKNGKIFVATHDGELYTVDLELWEILNR